MLHSVSVQRHFAARLNGEAAHGKMGCLFSRNQHLLAHTYGIRDCLAVNIIDVLYRHTHSY